MGTVPTPGTNLLLGLSFGGEEKWHDKAGAGWLVLEDEIFKAKEACLGYIFPSAVREEEGSLDPAGASPLPPPYSKSHATQNLLQYCLLMTINTASFDNIT